MKIKKTLPIPIFILMSISGQMVYSQGISEKMKIVDKLNSQQEMVISEAYWLLVNNEMRVKPEYRSDLQVRNSLWNALRFLVPEPVNVKPEGSEGNTTADYLLYIMGDVSETRAIPYLMKNIGFGGFRDSLARMGDEAVPPVLSLLDSGSETEKLYAADVLKLMLEPKPKEIVVGYRDPIKGFQHKTVSNASYGLYEASGKTRDKIKAALKKQLKDGSVGVKESALAAYVYVADDGDIRMLEDITKNDAHKIQGARLKNGERFPLREQAQKALERIKENKLRNQTINAEMQKSTTTK